VGEGVQSENFAYCCHVQQYEAICNNMKPSATIVLRGEGVQSELASPTAAICNNMKPSDAPSPPKLTRHPGIAWESPLAREWG
jgi:hypothetical protein